MNDIDIIEKKESIECHKTMTISKYICITHLSSDKKNKMHFKKYWSKHKIYNKKLR